MPNQPTHTIRPMTVKDAAAFSKLSIAVMSEPDVYHYSEPDELDLSENGIAEWLEVMSHVPNSTAIAAFDGDEMLGAVMCMGGDRRALQHDAELIINITASARGQGLGTTLTQAALDWAQAHPTVNRVHLKVFHKNAPAIRVYEKLGFEVEGRLRRAVYRYGEYHDLIMMGLLL